MKVKIKKIHPDAVVSQYAKEGDAGLDLTAISVNMLESGAFEYATGLQIEIPEGYVGFVFPRSSIHKTGMRLANSVGVIDSGYRGEILCTFKEDAKLPLYSVGDRVAQLIILPYPNIQLEEVDELSQTERGEGRYGSTGK